MKTSKHCREIALCAAGVVGALWLVATQRAPEETLAWSTLFDLGHVPLFGLIALAILRVLKLAGCERRPHPFGIYWASWGIALLLGAGSEFAQTGAARSRDLWDFARNASGAGAFLWFAATLRPASFAGRSSRRRRLHRGAALALMVPMLIPALQVAGAYAGRASAFPDLCQFGAGWTTHFIGARRASFEFTPSPGRANRPGYAARITFRPAPFSSFSLREPYPNWLEKKSLRVEIVSELTHEVVLTLRVHDRWHNNDYTDRFNLELRVHPGINQFSIALAEVRAAPEGRDMDMREIRGLSLFAVEPEREFSLFLTDLGIGQTE